MTPEELSQIWNYQMEQLLNHVSNFKYALKNKEIGLIFNEFETKENIEILKIAKKEAEERFDKEREEAIKGIKASLISLKMIHPDLQSEQVLRKLLGSSQ